MERSLGQSSPEARSHWPALMVFLVIGAMGLFGAGLTLLVAYSELGGALALLARHALRLVSPFVWRGGALAVVLWIVVLGRAWRES